MHFRSKTNFFTKNSGKFLPPMYEQSKFVTVNLLEGIVYLEKALQSSLKGRKTGNKVLTKSYYYCLLLGGRCSEKRFGRERYFIMYSPCYIDVLKFKTQMVGACMCKFASSTIVISLIVIS